MGEPITGQWGRIYTAPYSGAAKWGTGVNPIHQFYGEDGDPLRVYGRPVNRNAGFPGDLQGHPGHTPPFVASSDFIEIGAPWGYQPEDIAGLDVFQLSSEDENRRGAQFVQDDLPEWEPGGEVQGSMEGANSNSGAGAAAYYETPRTRREIDPRSRVPWGSGPIINAMLRRINLGPGMVNTLNKGGPTSHPENPYSFQTPMETVSEGWINKAASGMEMGQNADDVVPSDPAQYERQTSMQQRYRTLSNERAVLRGADEPREPIASRIAPMKLKVYSEGQRHYDMDPYQIDDIPRPFWYRRAGTGRDVEMMPNEMYVIDPLQRTPPPDPTLGPTDQTISDPNTEPAFGYTTEDNQGWY